MAPPLFVPFYILVSNLFRGHWASWVAPAELAGPTSSIDHEIVSNNNNKVVTEMEMVVLHNPQCKYKCETRKCNWLNELTKLPRHVEAPMFRTRIRSSNAVAFSSILH